MKDAKYQVNAMKFRRYLKRASDPESRSPQPRVRLKRRSITEQPTYVNKSVPPDQSDECASVSQKDEVE